MRFSKALVPAFALSLALLSSTASAQIMDLLRGKTEHKSQLYVYDVRGSVDAPVIKDMVFKALTEQGTNGFVKDNIVTGDAPRYPAKMEFQEMSFMAVNVQIPSCKGATFTISSADSSMSSWGDSAQYMACGFRYAGGWRVSMYISMQTSGGGISGILSGKTIGKAITGAFGMTSDPVKFIETSVDKLEQQLKDGGIQYALVESSPVNPSRVAVDDPLMKGKAVAEQRAADRGKRMAARADLQKLGIDAADRGRFIRAIQASDEDVVALFLEAGAIDLGHADSTGRKPIDYATKASIKDLLRPI